MEYLTILLVLIIFILIAKCQIKQFETFNGTGALTQLNAKGPQDTYLNGNVTVAFDYSDGLYIGKYPYYQYVFNSEYY
jgi:hypothetical protein